MLLDEAKKVLAAAGYKVVSEKTELQESFRDFKRKLVVESEDEDDDDYVLPDHQKNEPDPSTYRDDLDDVKDWEHCPAYYGKADTLDDDDYIDPGETVEDGLDDDDYIDPETNLDDEPIEDYNGEEENICPSCGKPFTGEGYEDEDGKWYCSEDCYESAMQMATDVWLDAYKDRMYGESCECGKKGCCCGGKKSKKKGKKGKSNKGWVPFWQYKKGKKDED